MDILDDMGVSKLSANIFLKVNYSFNGCTDMNISVHSLYLQTDNRYMYCEKMKIYVKN